MFQDVLNRLRWSTTLLLFSRNSYKHQMIFFWVQLPKGKQLRAAYVVGRPNGHPDFLSQLKLLLGNNSSFYPPAHFCDVGFDVLKQFYMFHLVFLPPSFSLSFYFSILYPPVNGNPSPLEKRVFFSIKVILIFDFTSIERLKYRKDLWGCQEDIIQYLKVRFILA